jgi:hypothetical protein
MRVIANREIIGIVFDNLSIDHRLDRAYVMRFFPAKRCGPKKKTIRREKRAISTPKDYTSVRSLL